MVDIEGVRPFILSQVTGLIVGAPKRYILEQKPSSSMSLLDITGWHIGSLPVRNNDQCELVSSDGRRRKFLKPCLSFFPSISPAEKWAKVTIRILYELHAAKALFFFSRILSYTFLCNPLKNPPRAIFFLKASLVYLVS